MIGRRSPGSHLLGFVAAFGLAVSAVPAPAQAADSISGTWDLYWQTRRGPRKSGWMVFRQNGSELRAELHGKGQVNVRGTVSGNSFSLRGTRMLVSYRIEGSWQGDRLQGAFRVVGVNKPFTGIRRP